MSEPIGNKRELPTALCRFRIKAHLYSLNIKITKAENHGILGPKSFLFGMLYDKWRQGGYIKHLIPELLLWEINRGLVESEEMNDFLSWKVEILTPFAILVLALLCNQPSGTVAL